MLTIITLQEALIVEWEQYNQRNSKIYLNLEVYSIIQVYVSKIKLNMKVNI